jgi:HEPN domain-containing protein
MKNAADLARQLAQKAANDLAAARIGLEHDAPVDTVCFHVQQAAEKLLKAALAAREIDYPFTHELRELLECALPHYPLLKAFRDTVPDYTEFAVRLRYDDIPYVTVREAAEAFREVERLH